jgi:hypothetical protein
MEPMIVYGKNEDETIKLTAEKHGLSEVDVRFMLAVARGERDGDVVDVEAPRRQAAPRPATRRPRRGRRAAGVV